MNYFICISLQIKTDLESLKKDGTIDQSFIEINWFGKFSSELSHERRYYYKTLQLTRVKLKYHFRKSAGYYTNT